MLYGQRASQRKYRVWKRFLSDQPSFSKITVQFFLRLMSWWFTEDLKSKSINAPGICTWFELNEIWYQYFFRFVHFSYSFSVKNIEILSYKWFFRAMSWIYLNFQFLSERNSFSISCWTKNKTHHISFHCNCSMFSYSIAHTQCIYVQQIWPWM